MKVNVFYRDKAQPKLERYLQVKSILNHVLTMSDKEYESHPVIKEVMDYLSTKFNISSIVIESVVPLKDVS